jgi:hypothetical protein
MEANVCRTKFDSLSLYNIYLDTITYILIPLSFILIVQLPYSCTGMDLSPLFTVVTKLYSLQISSEWFHM